MRREQLDLVVDIESILPGHRRLEVVARPRERRAEIPVRGGLGQLRARRLEELLDLPRPVKILAHVRGLVPVRGSHGALGRCRVQVRLVSILPQVQFAALESFARQTDRV